MRNLFYQNHKPACLFLTVCLLLSVALFVKAQSASFLLSPSSGSFSQGEYFSINLKLETDNTSINAAHAVVYFPKEKIELVGISKDKSIFTLWAEEPQLTGDLSEVNLLGGVPHPGFIGNGNIITLNFQAKTAGLVQISLEEGKILANDGQGTDVLTFIKEGKYLVLDENRQDNKDLLISIFSPTHPSQDEWYNNNNPVFTWQVDNVKQASFVLDRNPITIPKNIAEDLLSEKGYQDLKDGIWYFHLKINTDNGWTALEHYKVQIDANPPLPFEVVVNNYGDITNPSPELYFSTEDNISGLSHYKIKIGEEDFSEVLLAQINPFVLSNKIPGAYPLIVRAIDQAGNNVESKALLDIKPIKAPQIVICPATYQAGEESIYLSGTSLENTLVRLLLVQNQNIVKEWNVLSSQEGEWSFWVEELFKTGTYDLFVQAEDERGAVSDIIEGCKIEIVLNGLMVGRWAISFRDLTLFLLFIFFVGIIIILCLIFKSKKAVRELRMEIREAQQGLGKSFKELEKKIEQKIEFLDSQPGFSRKEQKIYQSLKKDLAKAEASISKGMRDIDKKVG